MKRNSLRWIPALILGTWLPGAAAMGETLPGQSPPCKTVKQGEELQTIPEIATKRDDTELSTTFTVQTQQLCVPTTKNNDNTWNTAEMTLRTYLYKTSRGAPELRWGYPGPTLRLRKANDHGQGGQRLKILLVNELEPESDDNACNNVCPASQKCDCSPAAVEALIKRCTATRPPQECCCVAQCTQKSPNCLHGSNTTNLHFHGSHASPQPPQDYVLLDLKPAGSTSDGHSSHGVHGEVEIGKYQYNVDPFGWRQPEGTHWYHPHKHGSVGGQVANGMAGAMIIEGGFDDWLKQFYKQEKLIVIQQINVKDNFYAGPQGAAPQLLVNGQIQPKITGAPGEVQRWRFVNATMSSGALISLTLPDGLEFRQIAMDGVRFSRVNYGCQPLLNFNVNNPSFPCNPNPAGNPTLRFAPGNRADFLVRFPQTETPKDKGLRVERKIIPISGDEGGKGSGGRKLLMQREEQSAPGSTEPALFTVVVDDGIPGNERRRGKRLAAPPWRPTQAEWPPMPTYLQNITDEEVGNRTVKMIFQQFISGMNPPQPWPYNQSPLSKFTIDGRQFDSTCANVTTVLGKAAEWTVSNDTVIPHPFHIHTNPFQLMSIKGKSIRENGAEPVWMDTLSMPNATVNLKTPPTDPKTPITITRTNFVTRQRYDDFTGEYVLHCHFLGHEDRGMMFSVQTVCPEGNPHSAGKYGRSTVLPPDECAGPPPFPDALPPCK
jgi:FtsP/CotA-like multicopper oxidase with cupredoxin domain